MPAEHTLSDKRVLFVFSSLELGGAERQGLHLARHLKGLGCTVRVWSALAGPGLVAERCEEAGIPWEVHRFHWPCRKISLARDSWLLLRALRRERPDVILPYTNWPNVGCGLVWRWSPAKVCIWGQRNIWQLAGDAVERLAYRRVSAVVCNAEHMVGYLRRVMGETHVPIRVVHNGLDLAPCAKTRAAWRAQLGIAEQVPVAVMVANFRREKDHATLLRAWKTLTQDTGRGQTPPRLLLAGAAQDSYGAVQELAGELGLSHTVRFLGQVRDVSGLLSASDIGVLCSKSEGLSNSLIEYMASGLPVVATDLPGNREALGPGDGQFLCEPSDADALAERLRLLLRAPALRQEIGARNRSRAAAEFSIHAMCDASTRIVGDLLDAQTRRNGARS